MVCEKRYIGTGYHQVTKNLDLKKYQQNYESGLPNSTLNMLARLKSVLLLDVFIERAFKFMSVSRRHALEWNELGKCVKPTKPLHAYFVLRQPVQTTIVCLSGAIVCVLLWFYWRFYRAKQKSIFPGILDGGGGCIRKGR